MIGSLLGWNKPKRNDIAKDEPELSAAFVTLVKRALKADPTRKHALINDIYGGSIRGVHVGNWRITVQPIEGEFQPCS